MISRFLGFALIVLTLSGCGSPDFWWEERGAGRITTGAIPQAPPQRGVLARPADGMVTVKRGDSLYLLAKRYNVSLRGLIDANEALSPPYRIYPGQRLVLPGPRYHVVERGDTLYGISRRYGADMASLSSLNGLYAPYALNVGQRLQIPSGAKESDGSRPQAVAARVGTPLAAPGRSAQGPSGPTPRARPAAAGGPLAAKMPRPKPPLPAPPAVAGSFIWPAQGRIVSSFGPKEDGFHNDGINIALPVGTSVQAAESGVVAYAGNELKGYGNLVLIRHANGWITAYAHNSELLVSRGQSVFRGQPIAKSGSSGSVTTPQLHFELRRGTEAVNPLTVVKGA